MRAIYGASLVSSLNPNPSKAQDQKLKTIARKLQWILVLGFYAGHYEYAAMEVIIRLMAAIKTTLEAL